MQSYDHFLNCANFQAFFLKTFFSGRLRRSVGQGRFPFCGCKGTAICRTGKIFHRKNSNKFSQIFTHSWRPTTYTKKFSHAKTAPKKQCASRTPAHTLYNIRNEFLIKISDSIKLHFFSAKKIRKATFVAYFNFDSFLIHFKFCHIRRFT